MASNFDLWAILLFLEESRRAPGLPKVAKKYLGLSFSCFERHHVCEARGRPLDMRDPHALLLHPRRWLDFHGTGICSTREGRRATRVPSSVGHTSFHKPGCSFAAANALEVFHHRIGRRHRGDSRTACRAPASGSASCSLLCVPTSRARAGSPSRARHPQSPPVLPCIFQDRVLRSFGPPPAA